ncbi:MAG: hypothetical protein ALAOOOJD_02290 [bacterium]|nr:hypothetical protein [bacterium]
MKKIKLANLRFPVNFQEWLLMFSIISVCRKAGIILNQEKRADFLKERLELSIVL